VTSESSLRRAVALLALLLGGAVWAATARAADPLASCRTIADDVRRLACYDALPPASATPAAAAVPGVDKSTGVVVPAATATAPAVQTERDFGAETVTGKLEQGPQSIRAHVLGNIDGIKRGAILHLDNGQIWQSVGDREYPAYEADNPAITIERNLVGSYWAHLDHGAFNLRVTRVE
jgi:hypothetical protein